METAIERKHYPAEMDVPLAATYLGVNTMYAYALVSTGVVPSRMEGRRRVVRKSDLDEFLAQRTSRTA
jgi:excisionase family DNA binding protein